MSRLLFPALLCLLAVTACGSNPPEKVDYENSVTLPPLEVPPELTPPATEGGMDIPSVESSAREVLPQVAQVRVMRDGQMRWLVVDAPVAEVWPRLIKFWAKQGFELGRQDGALGILETKWVEKPADAPKGFIRGMISKAFPGDNSADTRDKFRIRVERGSAPGSTEVYLTHYGVEEVVKDKTRTVWQSRPSDPELVAEFLQRLLLFMGVRNEPAVAAAEPEARPLSLTAVAGVPTLEIPEPFARAWRRVGIALDRAGIGVEDRDRSKGVYYVRAEQKVLMPDEEEKGFLSGLFASNETGETREERRFQIRVAERPGGAAVTVREADGQPVEAKIAQAVLSRLEAQLR